MTSRNPIRIGFLAFDDMQALDLFGPLEAFQTANEQSESTRRYELFVLTERGGAVTSSSGVQILAQQSLDDAPTLDTLVIVGGRGARKVNFSAYTLRWIRARAESCRRVCSVCTGLFILARTGLLDGRATTTHWLHVDEARTAFPQLEVRSDALFIRTGKFATSAGVTSGIDLALSLIEDDFGSSVAAQVARHLVVFVQRPGDQRQYSGALEQQARTRHAFADLVAWIADHLGDPLSAADLAAKVNLSERQFRRRFKALTGRTPARYLEEARIDAATDGLLTPGASMKQVARSVGYLNEDSFRRAFKRQRGVLPSEYRARFARSDS